MYTYKTKGTCSQQIEFDIDDNGTVTACQFTRGCSGNLQGVSRLIIGRPAEEIIPLLKGIQCQNGTSCPDQLATALEGCLAAREGQTAAK